MSRLGSTFHHGLLVTPRTSGLMLRESSRRHRQQRLVTMPESEFPWGLVVWGTGTCLLAWSVMTLCVLPLMQELMPLLSH